MQPSESEQHDAMTVPQIAGSGPPLTMDQRRADGWRWIAAQLRLIADRIEVLSTDHSRDTED